MPKKRKKVDPRFVKIEINEKAIAAIDKVFSAFPHNNFPYDESQMAVSGINFYFNLGEEEKAQELTAHELMKSVEGRKRRLQQYNTKYSNLGKNVDETEKIPAYKRQGIQLDESQESNTSKFYLDTEEDEVQIRPNNFFDDNVD